MTETKENPSRWLLGDKLHRKGAPALIWAKDEWSWWHYGQRHRIDGPAVKTSAKTLIWYKFGKRHRIDGPAVIQKNGTVEWFLDNKKLNFDEWLELTPIFEEERLMLKLKYM